MEGGGLRSRKWIFKVGLTGEPRRRKGKEGTRKKRKRGMGRKEGQGKFRRGEWTTIIRRNAEV